MQYGGFVLATQCGYTNKHFQTANSSPGAPTNRRTLEDGDKNNMSHPYEHLEKHT